MNACAFYDTLTTLYKTCILKRGEKKKVCFFFFFLSLHIALTLTHTNIRTKHSLILHSPFAWSFPLTAVSVGVNYCDVPVCVCDYGLTTVFSLTLQKKMMITLCCVIIGIVGFSYLYSFFS